MPDHVPALIPTEFNHSLKVGKGLLDEGAVRRNAFFALAELQPQFSEADPVRFLKKDVLNVPGVFL